MAEHQVDTDVPIAAPIRLNSAPVSAQADPGLHPPSRASSHPVEPVQEKVIKIDESEEARHKVEALAAATPHLDVKGAFPHSSDISNEAIHAAAECIFADARDHHVYFDERGFHNHLIHIILADLSLGASADRVREIYAAKEGRQKRVNHSEDLDDFEWYSKRCLGNQEYYQAYLAFFKKKVSKMGIKDAIEEYIFTNKGNMLERFISGAYHPMIHVGYGVEFNIPLMVAEGLAQTAIHSPSAAALFPEEEYMLRALRIYQGSTNTSSARRDRTALDIAMEVVKDARFDEMVKFADSPKYKHFLTNKKGVDLVLEYVDGWYIPHGSHSALLEKAGELMAMAAAMYAGPQRPGKAAYLDFFLMHTLTSSLFLPAFIELLDAKSSIVLLTSKYANDLAYFVARGRPELNLKQFETVKAEPWGKIFDLAIAHDDEHVPKAIRALLQASLYDSKNQYLGKDPDAAYRAMAALTLEADGHWNQDGIGFDEVWKKVPNLPKKEATSPPAAPTLNFSGE